MKMTVLLAATLLLPSVLFAQDARKPMRSSSASSTAKRLTAGRSRTARSRCKTAASSSRAATAGCGAEKIYGDFVLELEWKAVKKEQYDSGVFIRAVPPPERPRGPSEPGQSPPGLMGNIQQYKGAVARTDLVKPGDWNHFRLVVVGKTAELLINGKQAWKIDNLTPASGLIGLQCEVPGGGQFLFRNIRISER